jgi:hypothetical protein
MHGFRSTEEEISFFKEMKPEIESLLLYYENLLRIEIGKPIGNKKHEEDHYEKELQKLKEFFDDNNFLYKYYRSGLTYLDDKLFVREYNDAKRIHVHGLNSDECFTSISDQVISKVLANEMLKDYLIRAINKLNSNNSESRKNDKNVLLKWTDSKTGLIELMYALQRKGCFNNGQAEIKEIAEFFEQILDIDLGNYYRTFQEIRIRKSGRTNFLDQLKAVLIQYMDEVDLNFRR